MTRFQLTANRLTESWMDLLPELEANDQNVLATIALCRVAHEEQQKSIAAATPRAAPHVVM